MFWLAFGVSLSTWALIYSPWRFPFAKTVRFEGRINGIPLNQELTLIGTPLSEVLAATSASWRLEGWKTATGNLNLAALLSGLRGGETLFSAFVHVSLFEKGETYRILGLWSGPGQKRTYEWVGESPKMTFEDSRSRSKWDFPLKPPPEAFNLYSGSVKDLLIAGWSCPFVPDAKIRFSRYASAQKFFQTRWVHNREEEMCFLKNNSKTLAAVLSSAGGRTRVSLLRINN
jgi:hypothetical protein